MGDVNRSFKYRYVIRAKEGSQIRSNSLESARQVAVKRLESTLGKANFLLRLHKFPHHILRENPLASGAGADRLSTGMKMSFGKPIGLAAQVQAGDIIYEVRSDNEAIAKKALELIKCKLPNSYSIIPEPLAPGQH
jgi:large subunit ribosomal protein L10e